VTAKWAFALLLWCSLAAAPALGQSSQPVGLFEAARESLFGDVYAEPSTWRALPASTFFSEGWNEPWASPPPGRGGAPRQGWINAYDGVFYRLGIVTFGFADDVNDAGQYRSDLTLYTPFNRRFEIQADVPFVISNVSADDGDRHTDFGDFQITPRFLISESESFTQSFNLSFRTPTGDSRNGNDVSAVTPTWNFWSNPWQGLVVRGGFGITVPWGGFDAGARTSLLGNLAVGYYFTPHDRTPFGDFVAYLATNVTQPVDDRGAKKTTVTITPGFRTHLGANWYLLGGVEVPVTNPEPFDYQVIAGLMKVF
jgi:hypothetical protein